MNNSQAFFLEPENPKNEVEILKEEVTQLKMMLGDLRGEVAKIMSTHAGQRQEYEDRMDYHREGIKWVREECILLRAGLQKLENVSTQFEN